MQFFLCTRTKNNDTGYETHPPFICESLTYCNITNMKWKKKLNWKCCVHNVQQGKKVCLKWGSIGWIFGKLCTVWQQWITKKTEKQCKNIIIEMTKKAESPLCQSIAMNLNSITSFVHIWSRSSLISMSILFVVAFIFSLSLRHLAFQSNEFKCVLISILYQRTWAIEKQSTKLAVAYDHSQFLVNKFMNEE